MKNGILILIIGLLFLSGKAQFVPQYGLVEHFTNTRCVICPPFNADLYQSLEDNPAFLHHIAYHPPVPYAQDTFYRANPEPQNTRRLHYGVSGTPKAFFQGVDQRQGQSLLPASVIAASRGNQSPMDIQVNEIINLGQMQVIVNVRSLGNLALPDTGQLRLFVVIVEDSVFFPANNGEEWHRNLFRTALTDMEGQPFVPAATEEAIPFTFNYQIDNTWNEDKLKVLAFVFHDTNLFINSGSSQDLRVSTSSTFSGSTAGSRATATPQGGFPPYTYKWNDPDSQITATASGLSPGDYLVTVSDQSGLQVQEKVSIQATVDISRYYSRPPSIRVEQNILITRGLTGDQIEIKMWDTSGKEVYGGVLKGMTQAVLPSLSPGVYMVEAKGKRASLRQKVLIR